MVLSRSLVAVSLPLLAGCVAGSGRMESRTFELSDFGTIRGSHALHLEVARGEAFSVAVTTDDNLWEFVRVAAVGDALEIGHHPGPVQAVGTLSARVTMPALRGLELSGASGARLVGFDERVPRFTVTASGASELDGAVVADALELRLSGASGAELAGVATITLVEASGSSSLDLFDLTSGTASVTLSGASGANITVDQRLDYQLSGSSRLVYGGSPEVGRAELTGGSGVSRR